MRRRDFLALACVLTLRYARAEDVRFPDVAAGMPLEFPRDEGAHPDFRNEWWYVTGWLRDGQGHDFGFQVTFFRNRPGVAETNASAFAAKQLLFAHAAIADPGLGHLVVAEKAAREGFGLAFARGGATNVAIDDWSLVQRGDRFATSVRAPEFALELALDADAPPLLEGDDGISRKGPDPRDASYYYSRPQLRVHGTLAREGRRHDVTGIAWLDHEWSSRYLMRGAVGWDWLGINFDGGAALMAFRIRSASGTALWAGGTYRDPSGRTTTFAPNDVDFSVHARWRSPRTGIDYPTAFAVHAGELAIILDPLLQDQELDARGGVGVIYWEGAVRAMIGGRVAGHGYLELTGYGTPLRI